LGELDPSNIKPYYSDNIFRMDVRDTGHFGSGVYFSTYKHSFRDKRDYDEKYGDIGNPSQLTQVDDHLFRVNFNIYKNLYKMKSEKQGDFLHRTLKEINNIFYTFLHNKADIFDNLSKRYLIVKSNLSKSNLNIPNYKEFINMLKNAYNDYKNESNNIASFSTRIMEFNGYNGVSVSVIQW
jgi:hypothetical protein